MESIRIILADDHVLVRQALGELLATMEEVTVVGEAGDGLEAIQKVRELQPDIVILDLAMPKLRGLEAIKEIKKSSATTKVIILSMYNKEEYIRQSLLNGASGYLLKKSASEELFASIRAVQQGNLFISPTISSTIISSWLSQSRPVKDLEDKKGPLTEREIEVLKLLGEGYTNKEISKLLHISSKTVESHRYNIMEKLELSSFADLVKYAIKNEIVQLD